jgi:adenylate cyclase
MAAVLAADVVGYTHLMCSDEALTYESYKSHRRELIDPMVASHGARVIKSTGDGFLAEFPSASAAVRCALLMQLSMAERNRDVSADRRIVFRIGLSYGRIIAETNDIYGEEVNIAARLQGLALPGGLAMSGKLVEIIQIALNLRLEDLGLQGLKNMDRPVHTYRYRDATWL